VVISELPDGVGHDIALPLNGYIWANKTSATVTVYNFYIGDSPNGTSGASVNTLNKNGGGVGGYYHWYTKETKLYLVKDGDGIITMYEYNISGNKLTIGNVTFTKMTSNELMSFKYPDNATVDKTLFHSWYNEKGAEWYFTTIYVANVPQDKYGHADNEGGDYTFYTIGNKLYLVDTPTAIFGGNPIQYTYAITTNNGIVTLTLTDSKGVKTMWTAN